MYLVYFVVIPLHPGVQRLALLYVLEVGEIFLQHFNDISFAGIGCGEDLTEVGEDSLHFFNWTLLGILDSTKVDECRLILHIRISIELFKHLLTTRITPKELARIPFPKTFVFFVLFVAKYLFVVIPLHPGVQRLALLYVLEVWQVVLEGLDDIGLGCIWM